MQRRPLARARNTESARTAPVSMHVPRGDSLADDLREARTQVSALRARLLATGIERDETLGLQALQQIDAVHEELRIVEEELHAQADEIVATRESLDFERRRYRELFDNAPEAYVVTDLSGNVLEANRKAGVLLNLDARLLVRKPLMTFVALSDRERFRELVPKIQEGTFRGELDLLPRNGTALSVSVTARRGCGVAGPASSIRWLMRAAAGADALRNARSRARELEEKNAVLQAALERVERERGELVRQLTLGSESVAEQVEAEQSL